MYERRNTVQQFDYTTLRKYSVQNDDFVWNKRILSENNSLIFKGGRTLTRNIFESIAIVSNKECNSHRLLVYKCDTSRLCGGWGDRQKGIVATFLLALLTKRVFIIDIDHPCRLDVLLLPNIYNWSSCYDFVKNFSGSKVIRLDYVDDRTAVKGIKSFNFDQEWSTQVVVVRINSLAVNEIRQHKLARSRLKWLTNVTNEEAVHLVLHTLFQPTGKILKDASKFYENKIKGRELICAHIRIGKNPSIPLDADLRFGPPFENTLLQFLKIFEENGTKAIYIASDSDTVKQEAQRSIKSYININRTIVHVDRLGKFKNLKSEACEGWNTVILEQFILSLCDTLILTRSGFGTMAAYLRGFNDNLFLFHPTKRTIVHTNLTGLQGTFNFL